MMLTGIVNRDAPSVVVVLRSGSRVGARRSRRAPIDGQRHVHGRREDEVGQDRRGRRCRARSIMRPAPPRVLGTEPLDAGLRRVAIALAAGRVDPLEKRAARVVEREEVDETDVLQHLGSSVARERIVVSEDRRAATARRRCPCPRSASFAAVRTHQRSSARSRVIVRRSVRADDVSDRPRSVDADEPLAVVEACEQCRPDCRARCAFRASRRPPHARSDPSPTSARSASPRRGPDTVARASRPRSARSGLQSRRSGTSLGPGAGASRSSSAAIRERESVASTQRVDEQVDRPVVPDVAERADRGRGDAPDRDRRAPRPKSRGTAG